jgi:hypothetical protein
MPKRDTSVSGELAELGRRLREFREAHAPRTRLPEELWAAAASAARREGLYRTARTLRLDYANLKRKIETPAKRRAAAQKTASRKRRSAPPKRTETAKRRIPPTAFVELLADSIGGDCLIEVEGAGGARMRIRMRMSTPEVLSLVRDWRDRGAEARGEGQA